MKVKNRQKPVCNLHGKQKYVLHIKTLQQALYHKLILKKVHRIIKFNQKAWIKDYINMSNNLKKKAKKIDFETKFFQLMNKPVLGKTIENVRKHIEILNL